MFTASRIIYLLCHVYYRYNRKKVCKIMSIFNLPDIRCRNTSCRRMGLKQVLISINRLVLQRLHNTARISTSFLFVPFFLLIQISNIMHILFHVENLSCTPRTSSSLYIVHLIWFPLFPSTILRSSKWLCVLWQIIRIS